MKRLITLLVMLSVLVLSIPAFAEIPHYIQFQGKATDDGGIPLDGTYKLTFRIYNVEAGEDPPIWSETHNVVEIEGGVFSVLLGEVNPLNIPFDKSYWISMEIGTIDRLNELPRQLISSVGYAYRAKTAATLDVQTQDLDMGGHKIINVADPTAAQDATTKKYVDSKRQVFTSSGTFTAPPGVTKVFLTMVGGGGGGGGTHWRNGTHTDSGSGGGGGASVIQASYPVTPESNYSVTVGAGGAGGADENDGVGGGASSFDNLSVNGGSKGLKGADPSGAAGGAADNGAGGQPVAGGQITIAGGNGGNGSYGSPGGGGGGSCLGIGGVGGVLNSNGNAPTHGYGGGGGGGGGEKDTHVDHAGGAGTPGIVIVEW